jgi:hypothetical protein
MKWKVFTGIILATAAHNSIATLFTLLIVPSLYILIAKDHRGETPSMPGNEATL